MEAGETPEGALLREDVEELGIAPAGDSLIPIGFASGFSEAARAANQVLVILLYACREWTGTPQPHSCPSIRPRCQMKTTSPEEQKPGSWPRMRSTSVLPLRPKPPM